MATQGNKSSLLIWIDLEMSGLDPFTDTILEIATVVTNNDLQIIEEGPVVAISQTAEVLEGMDEWNRKHHRRSGLIDRCLASADGMDSAKRISLDFLQSHVGAKQSPMCGNSICQDRRFLARCMPELEAFFHYKNLDVSTIGELYRRWYPEGKRKEFTKEHRHQALADIRESIAELSFYREHIFHRPEVF